MPQGSNRKSAKGKSLLDTYTVQFAGQKERVGRRNIVLSNSRFLLAKESCVLDLPQVLRQKTGTCEG